jgi:hypothetical protein
MSLMQRVSGFEIVLSLKVIPTDNSFMRRFAAHIRQILLRGMLIDGSATRQSGEQSNCRHNFHVYSYNESGRLAPYMFFFLFLFLLIF